MRYENEIPLTPARPFQTNVGPILLSVNPYHEVGNALTLTSTRTAAHSPHLLRVVHEAVRQQSETGYPQAIILSGECDWAGTGAGRGAGRGGTGRGRECDREGKGEGMGMVRRGRGRRSKGKGRG